MILKRLLGDVPRSVFMEEHYTAQPFSLPHAADSFTELGSWDVVESLLAADDADVILCRQGQRRELNGPPSFTEAKQLFDAGHTILVRHAERQNSRLRKLADDFWRDFRAPVNVHVYCTPAGEYGFGWHYDAEEVFILQTEGQKEYSLRKNTVNPWPLVETLPADMKFERELMPLMKCLLAAGDWLYIPNGYWHLGIAREDSISLAVGVMAPTAVDVLDFLRGQLLSSMLWRQRLPTVGEASSLSPEEFIRRYRALFAELADDLSKTLDSEAFLQSFLRSRGSGKQDAPRR